MLTTRIHWSSLPKRLTLKRAASEFTRRRLFYVMLCTACFWTTIANSQTSDRKKKVPVLKAESTSIRNTSQDVRPRGLKPAAQKTKTKTKTVLADQPIENEQAVDEVEATESTAAVTAEQALELANEALDGVGLLTDDAERKAAFTRIQELLTLLETQKPNDPGTMFLSARVAVAAGRVLDAIEKLQAYLQTSEGRTDWHAHKLLGDLYLREYPQMASSSYKKALALKPSEPAVLLGLSNCLYQLGRRADAVAKARQAVQAESSTRTHAQLARMLLSDSNLAQAQVEAEKALELAIAAKDEASMSRGQIQVIDTQYKLLVEILQARLAGVNPDPQIYTKLAQQLRERADVVRKLALFDVFRALEAGIAAADDKPSAALREHYGITLAEIGRKDEAIEVLQKLLNDHPDRLTTQRALQALLDEKTESAKTLESTQAVGASDHQP